MGTIRETFILEDKVSASLDNIVKKMSYCNQVASQMSFSTSKISSAFAGVSSSGVEAMDATTNATKKATQGINQADAAGERFAATLKRIGRVALAAFSIKSIVGLSDTLTQTTARLDRMNDGLQTTAELNQMIYDSAMRARAGYQQTADFVSKLGTLAGNAFSSNAELVAFAEQINKQIALSGASSVAADAAMLQLTQGLSSGVLRGEELNSVLEQTPMIAQTIANYLGMTTGQMREFASEGKLSADIVKNAMLGAADETNAAFEAMPKTWSQVWTQFKNSATNALQPVLKGINSLANRVEDAAAWASTHKDFVVAAFSAITVAATVAGTSAAAAGIKAAAAWAAATWPILLVAAAVGSLVWVARKAGASFEEMGGIVGGVFGFMYASVMNTFVVPVQNLIASLVNFIGNAFNDMGAAVNMVFNDVANFIFGKLSAVAHGIQSLLQKIGINLDLTSGIDSMLNSVRASADSIKKSTDWKEYIGRMDYIDYTNAWNTGKSIGQNAGNFLDNFSLSDTLTSAASSLYAGAVGDINTTLGGISDSVSGIEKSVNLADEDIKSLVDMAERQYVNNINLTAQTPVINITGQNTGNTAADRRALANTIRDILVEQVAAGSVRTTARAF